jgi:hypothetical protein
VTHTTRPAEQDYELRRHEALLELARHLDAAADCQRYLTALEVHPNPPPIGSVLIRADRMGDRLAAPRDGVIRVWIDEGWTPVSSIS